VCHSDAFTLQALLFNGTEPYLTSCIQAAAEFHANNSPLHDVLLAAPESSVHQPVGQAVQFPVPSVLNVPENHHASSAPNRGNLTWTVITWKLIDAVV
jgi:hypothetical protein